MCMYKYINIYIHTYPCAHVYMFLYIYIYHIYTYFTLSCRFCVSRRRVLLEFVLFATNWTRFRTTQHNETIKFEKTFLKIRKTLSCNTLMCTENIFSAFCINENRLNSSKMHSLLLMSLFQQSTLP